MIFVRVDVYPSMYNSGVRTYFRSKHTPSFMLGRLGVLHVCSWYAVHRLGLRKLSKDFSFMKVLRDARLMNTSCSSQLSCRTLDKICPLALSSGLQLRLTTWSRLWQCNVAQNVHPWATWQYIYSSVCAFLRCMRVLPSVRCTDMNSSCDRQGTIFIDCIKCAGSFFACYSYCDTSVRNTPAQPARRGFASLPGSGAADIQVTIGRGKLCRKRQRIGRLRAHLNCARVSQESAVTVADDKIREKGIFFTANFDITQACKTMLPYGSLRWRDSSKAMAYHAICLKLC